MKKNSIHYGLSVCLMLVLALFTLSFSACSDDDNGGGVPEITGVRVPDPAKADSLFNKSGQGQTIVILGKNLGGALYVYINGQRVSFNSTMNTDHSIIVTVPSEVDGFKLSTFDSTVPDEIRVETPGGVATYAFKITSSYPQLRRLQAEYPREAGDEMLLYGLNLVDIERIYITDVTTEQLDNTTWTTVGGNHVDIPEYTDVTQNHYLNTTTNSYETESVVRVKVPAGAPEEGALVVECAAGTSYIGFNRMPGRPVILTWSNDMPQIGETLVITGREFVQVESLTYGDVTLTEDEFSVSASMDTIYVDFQKKPSVGSGTTLTVANPAGSASIDRFYDYTTILTTFDNGDAADNGWGPNATYPDSGTADGVYASINVYDWGSNWWGTMVYFRKDWSGNSFPLSDNIPDNAPASDIYFAFNVYDNNSAFNNGTCGAYIRHEIETISGNNVAYDFGFNWTDYDTGQFEFESTILGDIDGVNHKGKWYRTLTSLNNFSCFQDMDWAGIKAAGINQFRLMEYNQTSGPGQVDIMIDNVRVIYIPSN